MPSEATARIMGSVTRVSVLGCVAIAALLAAPVPILDEESYMAITQGLDPLRPYHWWRPWPPWYGGQEADAFVYAHPPLFLEWVAAWQRLTTDVRWLRWLCGVPLAGLLGWSAARVVQRLAKRPWLTWITWLATPIVVLGLQRGLMPDLMVAALGTAAIMGWLEAEQGDRRWAVFGGLALGLAAATKYPALALVPVFLVHGWRTRDLRQTWPFWVAALVPWILCEGLLAAVYGRIHLFEVLTRASEISRGTGPGRALGMLVRLPLGIAILALLVRGVRWMWLPAFLIAGCVFLWAWPADLNGGQRYMLAFLAVLGAIQLILGASNVVRGWRDPDTDGDRLLLGLWALAVLGSVWGVHNFAAPRYLLPAILPLAVMIVWEVGDRAVGRTLLWAGVAIHGVGALALTHAEHRFFQAGADLADEVAARYPEGRFTGEWSFRWRMDGHGWSFYTDEASPGQIVAGPTHGSPGALPGDWTVVERIESTDTFGLRVVHDGAQIGLYAETLGALPVGWSSDPMEEVTAWQVP